MAGTHDLGLDARRKMIETRLLEAYGIVARLERVVDVANPDDDKDFLRAHLPYGLDRPYLDLSKSVKVSSAVRQIALQCGEYGF